MKQFMDEDFLLSSDTAKHLYHDIAENLPVVDYHCHLSPEEIADDRRFETITQLMLGGDHYKWRVMRANGVEEKYITGDASDFDKFRMFAMTLPKCAGNPLYHWTHLELKRYFGFEQPLSEETCEKAYEICNEKLQSADFSARNLILRSNVKLVCTTDDPADDLRYHKRIKEDNDFPVQVLPAFRPDKALNLEKAGYADYIGSLSEACGFEIRDYSDFLKALTQRVEYFDAAGCRTADHGFDNFAFAPANEKTVQAAFEKALGGGHVDKIEAEQFKTAVLLYLCEEYTKRDWVLQLHFGCARNNNSLMMNAIGPDTGFDAISPYTGAGALIPFFNEVYSKKILPKTVCYSLDDRDNRLISTSIGCFQGQSKGRLQLGAAWWFNDTKQGMTRQLNDLASTGVLGNFIGMLTDSRSFISYTRHEYFRRILCDLVGSWVENGELPLNEDTERLITDISFNNVVNYFCFSL